MSDVISFVDTFTDLSATKSVFPISMARKRDIVFSQIVTAHSSDSNDETLTTKIYVTNADGTLHSNSAVWLLLVTFTVVNNASVQVVSENKTVVDDGAVKAVPLYAKVEYNIGGTTNIKFTGTLSISNHIAVVA